MSPNLLPLPDPVDAQVVHDPVKSILIMMVAFRDPAFYAGINEWVVQISGQIEAERRTTHRTLFNTIFLDGLAHVVDEAESFDRYLDKMGQLDAETLRNRLFTWTANSPHVQVTQEFAFDPIETPLALLDDYEAFCQHFDRLISIKKNKGATHQTSFDLFNNPQQLQEMLLPHLEWMWKEIILEEWERVRHRLERTAAQFHLLPLNDLTALEALGKVTSRDLSPAFDQARLSRFRHIRFIPHVHHGPYILWFGKESTMYFSFPARQAPLSTTFVSELIFDKVTLANRHQALADEVRLSILLALREAEELSTQEIIDRFELNKSAASRHLRQLVATSLIEERRTEGAKKVYRLNPKAIEELIRLLHRLH